MSAEKLFDSEIGATTSRGSFAIQHWRVTLDDDDDPDLVNPIDDDDLPIKGQGSTTFPGAIVRELSSSRIDDLRFFVVVQYGPPDSFLSPFGDGWQVSISGGSQNKHIFDERGVENPQIIGSKRYETIKAIASDPDNPDANPQHEVTVILTGGKKKVLLLQQFDERLATGMDIYAPVSSIQIFKSINGLVNYSIAANAAFTVNKKQFLNTFPPKTVLFETMNMVPSRVGHNVTLLFTFNRDGWTQKTFDVFDSEDGPATVHSINNSTDLVRNEFSGYETTDFEVFNNIEGPPTPIAPSPVKPVRPRP